MSTPLLSLEGISYAYDGQPPALEALSLSIHEGERIAVLGDNGAGKSTLFFCCNGSLPPQKGAIRYRGRLLSRSKGDLTLLRRSVGLVFQDPEQQIIASSVAGEVSFGPMNLGLPRPEVELRVEEALRALALTELRTRPPHDLSGGQKKRVTIADLLAMRPEILLLDEPTAALDYRAVLRLEDTLQDLSHSGISLLVSTHDTDFAWRWAERVLILSQGRLLFDGSTQSAFLQDELLDSSGLRRPLLLEAARSLAEALGHSLTSFPSPPSRLPRTPEEFHQFAKELLA